MKITVKFFAALREAMGKGEIERQIASNTTVGVLMDTLMKDYPALTPYASVIRIAVNRTYADGETLLHEGDEVACLPPVGGG